MSVTTWFRLQGAESAQRLQTPAAAVPLSTLTSPFSARQPAGQLCAISLGNPFRLGRQPFLRS